MIAVFGTGDLPFESEAEARGFLLARCFIQFHPPRGRVFMRPFHATTVEIAQVQGGWVINRTDPPQESEQ